MSGVRYLYGAAVQGIQDFIFQTNELRDIVGASELVDSICTTDFDEFGNSASENSIVRAAGNIKFIFDNREDCEKAVLGFPKKIREKAPGITISQAVVRISEGMDFGDVVDELESKLRTQRNRPDRSVTLGLSGIRRSRKTGLPAVKVVPGNDYLDEATLRKREGRVQTTVKVCEKAFGEGVNKESIAFNIKEITAQNDWIAIVHADGNGLGQVVQKIGKDKRRFQAFSRKLDQITRRAAIKAYEGVKSSFEGSKKIPIRPVVLSGDDLTVIIRGDLAIEYTSNFLKVFESETKAGFATPDFKGIIENGLTVCAGIAYIKSSYPFYYGYELAEKLCDRAKKRAKGIYKDLAPSCLMFHKVQDSFVEDYEKIVGRELTPCVGYSFEFGPYFKEKQSGYWSITDLMDKVEKLSSDEGNAVKSHLRQWMGLMHKRNGGIEQAEQKKKRLLSVFDTDRNQDLSLLINNVLNPIIRKSDDGSINVYPVYDVLALHSVFSQVIENNNKK